MKWLFQEPRRDPELQAALSRLEADSAPRDVEMLRQRIVAAARPRLADLRAPATRWWEWITRWMPIAVPIGLAVSLAGGLLVPGSNYLTTLSASSMEASSDSALVVAAYSEPGTAGQLTHVIAPENADWLLEQAFRQ